MTMSIHFLYYAIVALPYILCNSILYSCSNKRVIWRELYPWDSLSDLVLHSSINQCVVNGSTLMRYLFIYFVCNFNAHMLTVGTDRQKETDKLNLILY